MKTKIIALIGEQGCGKTTLAKELVMKAPIFSVSFADPIRQMLAQLMDDGVEPEDLRTIDKDTPMAAFNGKTYRHAAQTLGTEWARDCMGHDMWINQMRLKLEDFKESPYPAVIDDARFANEFEMLKEYDSLIIRIHRNDAPEQSSDHTSEKDWQKVIPDEHVYNNYPIDEAAKWIMCLINAKWPENTQ